MHLWVAQTELSFIGCPDCYPLHGESIYTNRDVKTAPTLPKLVDVVREGYEQGATGGCFGSATSAADHSELAMRNGCMWQLCRRWRGMRAHQARMRTWLTMKVRAAPMYRSSSSCARPFCMCAATLLRQSDIATCCLNLRVPSAVSQKLVQS